MNEDPRQLDSLEEALLELDAAEKGRVFDRTRVEPVELLKVNPAERLHAFRRRVLRWVPVAAVIGILALAGTSVFIGGDESGKNCAGEFVDCFTGPKQVALANGCVAYDYDGDSDVDMLDWSVLDLNCKGGLQANQ
ncbi:MAG: hypothetical protein ACYTFA_10370 [Planctomycetota bacterium]|jgi:hypothetical protein